MTNTSKRESNINQKKKKENGSEQKNQKPELFKVSKQIRILEL
jgi:hypothetical protein